MRPSRSAPVVVVGLALATFALASSSGCPPYDDLPYPDDAGVDAPPSPIACPAVDAPSCTTLVPEQLADWEQLDVDTAGTDAITALALHTATGSLWLATAVGEVYTVPAGARDAEKLRAFQTCSPLVPNRVFVAGAVAVFSGVGGVCVVESLEAGADATATYTEIVDPFLRIDVAAVPLDDTATDLLLVYAADERFRFARAARGAPAAATTINESVAIVPGATFEVVGLEVAPVDDTFGESGFSGAVVVDEASHLYLYNAANGVDPSAVVDVGVLAPDLGDKSTLIAVTGARVEVAVNELTGVPVYGSTTITDMLERAPSFTLADLNEVYVRDPLLFPGTDDKLEALYLTSTNLRIDVGRARLVTLVDVSTGAEPSIIPVGVCSRISNVVALDGEPCGPVWAVPFSRGVAMWDAAASSTLAVATFATAVGTMNSAEPRRIEIIDEDSAVIANGGGIAVVSLAPDTGDEGTVEIEEPGNVAARVVGSATNAERTKGIFADAQGRVFGFDLDDPFSAAELAGSIGNSFSAERFELVITGDAASTGDTITFFAAGTFGTDGVGVRRCDAFLAADSRVLECGESQNVPAFDALDGAGPGSEAVLSFIEVTSAGALLVGQDAIALDRGTGIYETVNVVEEELLGSTPFAEGAGDVVDLGGGCLALFGFGPFAFGIDASEAVGAGDAMDLRRVIGPPDVDPFPSSATLLASGTILAMGGQGNVMYRVDYDHEAATCSAMLNSVAPPIALGPRRPLKDVIRAVEFDGSIWVSDRDGNIWRLSVPLTIN